MNEIAEWMIKQGYATGHGDSVVDLLTELEWQVAEKEREMCAKLVEAIERLYSSIPPYRENGECTIPDHVVDFVNSALANAIRARGEK